MADEIKEKAVADSVATAEQADHRIEALTESVKALTKEITLVKETALATTAVSKGKIAQGVAETSPFTYLEGYNATELRSANDNALVLEGKGSGKMAIFAAHPEAFY